MPSCLARTKSIRPACHRWYWQYWQQDNHPWETVGVRFPFRRERDHLARHRPRNSFCPWLSLEAKPPEPAAAAQCTLLKVSRVNTAQFCNTGKQIKQIPFRFSFLFQKFPDIKQIKLTVTTVILLTEWLGKRIFCSFALN